MTVQTFEYPVFFRILYRYGNIPVTLLLILYLIPSIISFDRNLVYIIPVIIMLTLIYFINRRYLFLYKTVPYKIIADDEKLICSKFFLSRRETIVYYNDIINLSGGVFSGKLKGLMEVYDGKYKIYIGFFDKIKNANILQKIILTKVNREVYEKVLENTSFEIKK